MGLIFYKSFLIFLIYLILHILVTRLSKGRRFVIFSFGTFVVLEIISGWIFFDHDFKAPLLAMSFICSFWIVLMVVLISAQNSVSLRIFDEIDRAPSGRLAEETLKHVISPDGSVKRRIEIMATNGLLALDQNNEVRLTSRGRILALFAILMRRIFSVTNAG